MKKRIFLLLLMLAALCLAGCGEKPETPAASEPAPTEQTETQIPTEPEDVSWVQHTLRPQNTRTEFLTGRREQTKYYFEMSVWDDAACEAASGKMVRFLARTRALSGLAPEKDSLMVYTGDCITTWQEPGKAYLSSQEAGDLRAFWILYQAENPVISHAGLAYGLTAAVAREGELCSVPEYRDDQLRDYFSGTKHDYLLDMTLPMLENLFFSQEATTMVQAAACSLADFCIRQQGMEALARLALEGTDEELTNLTNDWLKELGIDTAYTRDQAERFYYAPKYSEEYPYYLDTPSAIWCFSVTDVREDGYKNFMKSYRKVSALAEADFQEAQEALSEVLQQEVHRVMIYTEYNLADTRASAAAYYDPMEEAIHIYFDWDNALYSVVHEYMHHLTIGKGKLIPTWSLWTEALAEEAAVFASSNRCEQAYYESYTREFKALGLVGEDGILDLAGLTYYNAQVYSHGYSYGPYLCISQFVRERPKELTADALSYAEAASIMHYLVEKYGRTDAYLNSTGIRELEEFLGMSFQELYAEWQEWNTERCRERGFDF